MWAYLNVRNDVIAVNTIAVGSLTATVVHPREVFKPALLCNAASVIVAHNHPSGNTTPSPEDTMAAKKLKNAAEILDIRLLDFIIIGDNDEYVSLMDRGVI
ncbi:MAG: hypothetical protein HZB80_01805 [Deltaproteobacteria bacterium]|nr:hypothetical protein [Deltaproteobacteria bacterium]